MAFNRKTFQTRTLTAIVFAAVMLTGLLWNHWSFLILFSIIHFGCWWEYFNLLEKIHDTTYHRHTRLGFMLIGFAIMLLFCGQAYEINNYRLKENFSFPVSVAGFVLLGMGIFQSKDSSLKTFGSAALGLMYISLCWGLIIGLRSTLIGYSENGHGYIDFGMMIPAGIIFSIWINDTMAYIVGSLIGKTSLSKVSPKKTWEGTIGGVILSIVIMGFISMWVKTDLYQTIIIAGLASVFGTLGDLLESKLKRMADVKDSGSIMPGHGGFLDRFDSMLLATPVVWLYVCLFM
jgi:phosphatidate cytidylyltransferase